MVEPMRVLLILSLAVVTTSLQLASTYASSPRMSDILLELTQRCALIESGHDPAPLTGREILRRRFAQFIVQGADAQQLTSELARTSPHCARLMESTGEGAGTTSYANQASNASPGSTTGGSTPTQALEPFFPWPPPQPFEYEVFTNRDFPEAQTLDAVANQLEGALRRAGYSGFRFFGVGNNGFALVTKLERINRDGHPFDGPARWQSISTAAFGLESFSLREYLLALFTPRVGRFRVFAVIVTPQDLVLATDKELDVASVEQWQRHGSAALPDMIGQQPFSERHRVFVLVYEFSKEEGEAPQVVDSGSALKHLKAAGITFGGGK